MALKGKVEGQKTNGNHRWLETVYDQHRSSRFPGGRPWWGWTEIPAQAGNLPDFCMEIVPGDHNAPENSSWEAPWMPGPQYLKPNVRARQLIIKYDLIKTEYQSAGRVYYEKATTIAYKKGWAMPALGEPMPYALEYLLGKPPISAKVVDAALAGDPWLLGFDPEPNYALQDLILGRPEQAFAQSPLLDIAQRPDGRQATPTDLISMTPDDLTALVNMLMDQRDQAKMNEKMAKARNARKTTETVSMAP